MSRSFFVLLACLMAAFAFLPACKIVSASDRDILFQESTISALMKGVYDGDSMVSDLRPHGDFGIGTFQALDGEMIVLDGKFYRARADGRIIPATDETRVPFAVVTFFDSDQKFNINSTNDIYQMQAYIDEKLGSRNYFYAIKAEGRFSYMKTRSIPPQNKPYRPLVEASKSQQITELRDVDGTLVGFKCPAYVEGVNVPGYHFHFIDKERKTGGHVLDLETMSVSVSIDLTPSFIMELPDTPGFNGAVLDNDSSNSLQEVEKGR